LTKEGKFQTGEGKFFMHSREFENKREEAAGKMSAILLKMSSEAIRVYLWFLQFSNYLLKLVQ
jgi:hypothetical protein